MGRVTLGGLGAFGVIRDQTPHDIPIEAFTDAKNVRFTPSGAERFTGSTQVLGNLLGGTTQRWIHYFPDRSQPTWIYASTTKVWCVASESSHAEITRTTGGAYTGIPSERWMGNGYNGRLLLNNAVDAPQDWPLFDTSGATKLRNLPNWMAGYSAKTIRPFKGFLVAGNLFDGTTRFPYRIRWSDLAEPGTVPGNWDLGNPASFGGERDLADTPDVIVDQLVMGDVNIIYKENSTWGMQFYGGQDIFKTWRFLDDQGLLARDCAVQYPSGHVVLTANDVGVHNGQRGSFTSILEGKLRKWLFKQIDQTNFFNCFLTKNEPLKEIWICIPESGSEYATLAIVWNYASGGVGFRELRTVPFADPGQTATFGSPGDDSWDGGADISWDADDAPWGGSTLASRGSNYVVMLEWKDPLAPAPQAVQTEATSLFDGDSYSSFLERTSLAIVGSDRSGKAVLDRDVFKLCTGIYPTIQASVGFQINVFLGTQEYIDEGITWYGPQTFTQGVDEFAEFLEQGRFLSVRFESKTDAPWTLVAYAMDLQPIGRHYG